MEIAILDLTGHPLPMLGNLPRASDLIIEWLLPSLPEAKFKCFDIAEKKQSLPHTTDFDGLLISGSEHGVYDFTSWNRPLRSLLIETKVALKPIFGICYGHQIIADTFGGRVEKADIGEIIGAKRFDFGSYSADAHVWHKDQVSIMPPQARITASALHCPVGALNYDFPAASVQFHPEFSEFQLRELFRRGVDHFLKKEQVLVAVESLDKANVCVGLRAEETAAFYRKYCRSTV